MDGVTAGATITQAEVTSIERKIATVLNTARVLPRDWISNVRKQDAVVEFFKGKTAPTDSISYIDFQAIANQVELGNSVSCFEQGFKKYYATKGLTLN